MDVIKMHVYMNKIIKKTNIFTGHIKIMLVNMLMNTKKCT